MARIRGARRAPLVGRSQGRLTEWFSSRNATVGVTIPPASFVFDAVLTAAELAKRPFTITRTIGYISVSSDQVAAQEAPFGAIGMMVVSEKASVTGVTALPDPITEEVSDEWFLYKAWSASGGPIEGRPVRVFEFDSRAQRKVQDGDTLVVMVANAHSTHGAIYTPKYRILV